VAYLDYSSTPVLQYSSCYLPRGKKSQDISTNIWNSSLYISYLFIYLFIYSTISHGIPKDVLGKAGCENIRCESIKMYII